MRNHIQIKWLQNFKKESHRSKYPVDTVIRVIIEGTKMALASHL